MKDVNLRLTVLLATLALLGAAPAFAQEEEAEIREEIRIEENRLDQIAMTPEGEENVKQLIKDQFMVNDELIESLREQQLGYGEITTTLALAEQMDGGINEDNVWRIVDLRTGETKAGWDTITRQFNVNVGDLKNSLKY